MSATPEKFFVAIVPSSKHCVSQPSKMGSISSLIVEQLRADADAKVAKRKAAVNFIERLMVAD